MKVVVMAYFLLFLYLLLVTDLTLGTSCASRFMTGAICPSWSNTQKSMTQILEIIFTWTWFLPVNFIKLQVGARTSFYELGTLYQGLLLTLIALPPCSHLSSVWKQSNDYFTPWFCFLRGYLFIMPSAASSLHSSFSSRSRDPVCVYWGRHVCHPCSQKGCHREGLLGCSE